MRNIIKILTILLFIVLSQTINAQNIFNLDEKDKAVYSRLGIEPTYVFALGYMQSFQLKAINRNAVAYGELSSPIKDFGINNYEVKAGGILNVVKWKNIGVTYNLNFSTGKVQTKNFSSQKYAFGNKLCLGSFQDKWFIALGGEYEKIFANKITHTEYYRDFIFPEAIDGWYNGAGGNIQLGLEAGLTIKEILDLRVEFKVPRSERFNSYNGSPGHINLTVAFRF